MLSPFQAAVACCRNQRGTNDPAVLLRDYQSFSTEYVKEYFHVLRIGAELADQDIFLPASAIAPIVQAEAESLKTLQADYRNERRFLEDAVMQADGQFAAQQATGEEKGVQADEEELDRVIKLVPPPFRVRA